MKPGRCCDLRRSRPPDTLGGVKSGGARRTPSRVSALASEGIKPLAGSGPSTSSWKKVRRRSHVANDPRTACLDRQGVRERPLRCLSSDGGAQASGFRSKRSVHHSPAGGVPADVAPLAPREGRRPGGHGTILVEQRGGANGGGRSLRPTADQVSRDGSSSGTTLP